MAQNLNTTVRSLTKDYGNTGVRLNLTLAHMFNLQMNRQLGCKFQEDLKNNKATLDQAKEIIDNMVRVNTFICQNDFKLPNTEDIWDIPVDNTL